MNETTKIRLRRLKMRSWRRGMKEMDLILGHFADSQLTVLEPAQLDAYEHVLTENDQDLYRWITARINDGGERGPEQIGTMLDLIAQNAFNRLRPDR